MVKFDLVADVIQLSLRRHYPKGDAPYTVRTIAEGILLDLALLERLISGEPTHESPLRQSDAVEKQEGRPGNNVILLEDYRRPQRTGTAL